MPNPNIIEIVDEPEIIIAQRSVVLTPGLRPRRIVLRKLPGKFVTHEEFMKVHIETRGEKYDYVVLSHEFFNNGHYFDFMPGDGAGEAAALNAAKEDFERRCK